MNRIERAIDVFLDAINSETLAKGTCTACAVGNLVAKGLDINIVEKSYLGVKKTKPIVRAYRTYATYPTGKSNSEWGQLFHTSDGQQTVRTTGFNSKLAEENIKATEFTMEELMKIEYAFETNTAIHHLEYCDYTAKEIRADQIKGLAAVIKVMESFPTEQPHTKSYAEDFVKRAELIPIQ